jgi:tetratricopeptide (TPR) repeat protein
VLLLLLLTAGAQAAAPAQPDPSYLQAADGYRTGQREKSLREIRQWPPRRIWAGIQSLHDEAERLRMAVIGEVKVRLPAGIDARTVEGAVLMHVEAGLLDLQALDMAGATVQFSAATSLVDWLHAQQEGRRRMLEQWRAIAAAEEPDRGLSEAFVRVLSLELKIGKPQLHAAIAGAALALGAPEAALPFAEKARAAGARDGETLLVHASVKESLALGEAARAQEDRARRLRGEAETLLREAMAADPALVEARLRLGGVVLALGRPQEAEPFLQQAAEQAADRRQRYLALLLLGRASERKEDSAGGAGFYRRALEAWPESQAARLGLARCLEASAGPSAARPLVMATLLDSRAGREPDPWWSYPFGPRELAKAMVERLWQGVLGRPFGS